MVKKNNHTIIFVLLFILITAWAITAAGDTIYLKDGTREESDRVWESENYVHFILKGTKTVEVRFSKEFVDHIERSSGSGASQTEPEKASTHQIKTERGLNPPEAKAYNSGKDASGQTPDGIDQSVVRNNKGVSFYDPHRPKRYWAGRNSRYKTLGEALSDLASTYGRSMEWVRQNMGDENDLGMIHDHLMQKLEAERQSQANPAVNSLAVHKPQPAQATRANKVRRPDSSPDNTRNASALEPDELRASDGPHFYDPRRDKKYWISDSKGFDTLNEALNGLAQMYQVSTDWVEAHMGESNRLEDIHRNLRRSLSTP